jgi:hypothetical protein
MYAANAAGRGAKLFKTKGTPSRFDTVSPEAVVKGGSDEETYF